MGLRINNNIAALNGHRQLLINDRELTKSLEKLASGMKINRAADGPADLIISEQLRAQISGLSQAIDNSETAVSMVQTTESALTEVSNLLVNIRELAIHAANEGANDDNMLEADQLELNNALNTIDRITNNAQFGVKKLLDGSTGANGVGIGSGLDFLSATPKTKASPVEGFEVRVFQAGTQAFKRGSVELTQEMVDAGEEIVIAEGGKTVSIKTEQGDSVDQAVGKLRNEIRENGLNLELIRHDDGTLEIRHNNFGSDAKFSLSSSSEGVLSAQSRTMEAATPGQDIQGSIGGEVALGKGLELEGGPGTKVDGLRVRYTGDIFTDADAGEGAEAAGRVGVFQNSLIFQVGGNPGQNTAVSLVNTNTRVLGRGVANESGFESIRELDVRSAVGAQSSILIMDAAIDDVTRTRAELGAFQKNTLESNLRQLRISVEEMTNAQSIIRDTDMAKEVTTFTRNSIMVQSATAMLAQANQIPQTVLSLLG